MARAAAVIGIGQTKYRTRREDVSIAGLMHRALAHATSGPCLQHKLLTLPEAV